jgi:SagB-type dehydrogenase family enzyme
VYRYHPRSHSIVRVLAGDQRREIARAALNQECVQTAPAVLVITAVLARTSAKYGERAERYVHMEVGHAAENVYLQAVSLGLGTVMVGAFEDDKMKKVLRLPKDEEPMALLPVGNPVR